MTTALAAYARPRALQVARGVEHVVIRHSQGGQAASPDVLEAGIDTYMLHPVEAPELLGEMRTLCRRRALAAHWKCTNVLTHLLGNSHIRVMFPSRHAHAAALP